MVEFSEDFPVKAEAGKEDSWRTVSGDEFEVGWTQEFDGSYEGAAPENFLATALANCFVATFKAVAERSSFDYDSISVDGELSVSPDGDGGTEVSSFEMTATLVTDEGELKAQKIMETAEEHCFVMDSVDIEKDVEFEIV